MAFVPIETVIKTLREKSKAVENSSSILINHTNKIVETTSYPFVSIIGAFFMGFLSLAIIIGIAYLYFVCRDRSWNMPTRLQCFPLLPMQSPRSPPPENQPFESDQNDELVNININPTAPTRSIYADESNDYSSITQILEKRNQTSILPFSLLPKNAPRPPLPPPPFKPDQNDRLVNLNISRSAQTRSIYANDSDDVSSITQILQKRNQTGTFTLDFSDSQQNRSIIVE
jgi:hypothetical protein